MATASVTLSPQVGGILKRDGIATCGYFDGDQNQPFVCPSSYSCTLVPFGAWWGCVNALHTKLADTCFDADNTQPNRGDVLNCSPSAPYCNTLYLESGAVTMTTWTCGATGGTSYMLRSFTGAGAASTTTGSTASSISQTALSTGPSLTRTTAEPTSSFATPTTSSSFATPSTSSSFATPSTSSSPSSHSSSGTPAGTIVAATIGAIAALIVAVIGFWGACVLARRSERHDRYLAEQREAFEMDQAERERRAGRD